MPRPVLLLTLLAASTLYAQVAPPAAPPQHEANFDSEKQKADALFAAHKYLEALPLYEDLSRQDPNQPVFAERSGIGLLAKEPTLSAPNDRLQIHLKAMAEFRRAQSLGDNSNYLRSILTADSKTLVGAIVVGIPLTVGYTYQGKPAAQSAYHDAEAAFGQGNWPAAAKLYAKASTIDPAWYAPALYTGDSFFRQKDIANAGIWYAKATAIDPDRETAFRYWGDALFEAHDVDGARARFVDAMVAEPYSPQPFFAVNQWAQRTGHPFGTPAIARPEFITPDGALKIDPDLAASTQNGRSSWIVYQQYRVAHGARTLNQFILAGSTDASAVVTPIGYHHTIAEEHAALRAMLADLNDKIKAGTLLEANLDPSLRNIRNLEQVDFLGAWIAINAADAGIRADYPSYRSNHRKHLVDYVNTYLIR